MWHVSISPGRAVFDLDPEPYFALALRELAGVGEPALGEWREVGDIAVHLRRRLNEAEAARVGPVRDVRQTWEHTKRLNAIRRYLPRPLRHLPDTALL